MDYTDKATDVTQKWIEDINDAANDIMNEINDGSDEFQNQKDIEQTVNKLLKEKFQ